MTSAFVPEHYIIGTFVLYRFWNRWFGICVIYVCLQLNYYYYTSVLLSSVLFISSVALFVLCLFWATVSHWFSHEWKRREEKKRDHAVKLKWYWMISFNLRFGHMPLARSYLLNLNSTWGSLAIDRINCNDYVISFRIPTSKLGKTNFFSSFSSCEKWRSKHKKKQTSWIFVIEVTY